MPGSIGAIHVRGADGEMIPLSTVLRIGEKTGAGMLQRFNLYRTAEISGGAAPGFSSGQALDAMEKLATAKLPPGFGFEWTGLAYQEKAAGGAQALIFGLALVFVFLVLAALYESWAIPFGVLLGLPIGVFGAFLGTLPAWARQRGVCPDRTRHAFGPGSQERDSHRGVRAHEARYRKTADPRGCAGRSPSAVPANSDDFICIHSRSGSADDRERRGISGAPFARDRGVQWHVGGDGARGAIRTGSVHRGGTGRGAIARIARTLRNSGRRGGAAVTRLAASAICVVLLLGGCTGPHYRRPEVPVPPTYRGQAVTAGDSTADNLGELQWEDLIHDEQLSKLIREALANNFDAQIAAARVLEARAQFPVSRSALLPSVDAHGAYNNLRAAADGSSHLPAGVSAYSDYSNLSAGTSWELDLWGRVRNSNAAARASLLASEEERRVVRQTVVSDVAAGYFLLLDLDREREITRRTLKLREDSLELVKLRVGARLFLRDGSSSGRSAGERRPCCAHESGTGE